MQHQTIESGVHQQGKSIVGSHTDLRERVPGRVDVGGIEQLGLSPELWPAPGPPGPVPRPPAPPGWWDTRPGPRPGRSRRRSGSSRAAPWLLHSRSLHLPRCLSWTWCGQYRVVGVGLRPSRGRVIRPVQRVEMPPLPKGLRAGLARRPRVPVGPNSLTNKQITNLHTEVCARYTHRLTPQLITQPYYKLTTFKNRSKRMKRNPRRADISRQVAGHPHIANRGHAITPGPAPQQDNQTRHG